MVLFKTEGLMILDYVHQISALVLEIADVSASQANKMKS